MILPPLNATAPRTEAPPVTSQATKIKPAISPVEIQGVSRGIVNRGMVSFAELAAQQALRPKSNAPMEIKPIHPPGGIPEGSRHGVSISPIPEPSANRV